MAFKKSKDDFSSGKDDILGGGGSSDDDLNDDELNDDELNELSRRAASIPEDQLAKGKQLSTFESSYANFDLENAAGVE